MNALDLTGRWSGRYRYPGPQAPVTFAASLVEAGGWLTGATEETATETEVRGQVLTATLQGKRDGLRVQFLKLYDRALRDYDAVAYEGRLSGDGKQIVGRWQIPGNWAGTFVMIRQGETATAIERRNAEKV